MSTRAFILIAGVTLFSALQLITYMSGRIHEQASRTAQQDALVQQQIDWHHRYDNLADAAGEGAVLEAALRAQGAGR